MTTDKTLLRFFEVAKFDLKHKHYKRTTDKQKLYRQLVTGEKLEKLLKRYVRRESKPLFEQRVRLTQHIVQAVSANLLASFYKVPRSNAARRTLMYKDDDGGAKIKEFEALLDKFNGAFSFDDYLATRLIDLGSTDPNAFIGIEWDAFDAEQELIAPRPFEIYSDMAVDYEEKNKTLEYLIVKQAIKFRKDKIEDIIADDGGELIKNPTTGLETGSRFTLYGKNQTHTLTQVAKHEIGTATLKDDRLTKIAKRIFIRLKGRLFEYVAHTPHNCDAVPAMRAGWNYDLATQGETYVNPLHAVEAYLLKTVKVNSELDLVAALLAFPQLIRYNVKCPDLKCYKGEYENGDKCGTCHGSGMRATAPSAQDSIELPLPNSKEEMLPLGDVAKYLHPDVGIIKWQEDYIEKLTEKAKRMLFNSDTFSPKQTAKTATGTNLDMQNVYDTLYSFSIHYSRTWTQGVRLMSKLADRQKDLVFRHSFGKDFKFKTLDGLIADLERVDKIGDAHLKRHIKDDIATIMYSENPTELMRYKLMEFYNPFSGKSEVEIQYLLGSQLVPLKSKILYANSGSILDAIELRFAKPDVKRGDFYALKRSEQIAEIDLEVDAIIDQIKTDSPTPDDSLNLI